MYCTYLVTYFGNKLPPFYIGSTSLFNINKGYLGSVMSKRYKDIWISEIKNNRNLFKIQIITKHHTRLEAFHKEEFLQRHLKVMNNPMYINRSYAVTGIDVSGVNNPMYGKKRPDSKERMKNNNPMKNTETKEKMIATRKLLNRPSKFKGVPNPIQKEKMLNNNPMKNESVKNKMVESRKKNNFGKDPCKDTIWVANLVTKVRKRMSQEDFNKLDGTWIKLGNRLPIPQLHTT